MEGGPVIFIFWRPKCELDAAPIPGTRETAKDASCIVCVIYESHMYSAKVPSYYYILLSSKKVRIYYSKIDCIQTKTMSILVLLRNSTHHDPTINILP